tara:strand:+ start:738 stop:1082 length:345 start_codon:yes stop_codon:yes gene_type:complete
MSLFKRIVLTGLIFFCTLNVGWVNADDNFNKHNSLVKPVEKNYSYKLESFLKENSKLNIEMVAKVNNDYVVTIPGSGKSKTIPESYVNSYFLNGNLEDAKSILDIISTTGPKNK